MDVSVINSLLLLVWMVLLTITAFACYEIGKREQEPRIDALRKRNRVLTERCDQLQQRLNGYGNVTQLRGPRPIAEYAEPINNADFDGYTPGGDDAA